MKTIKLNIIYVISLLSLMLMAISDIYAANIADGVTVTAPPQADELMNFTAPAPGGTFVIESGVTFTGALTNAAAGIGTLVLNSGSQLNGAVAAAVTVIVSVLVA
jgi:hypothetical protein